MTPDIQPWQERKLPEQGRDCHSGESLAESQVKGAEIADLRAALEAPARDRQADRVRHPDPLFNEWLDQSVTENGEFSVWHLLADTESAWAGWVQFGQRAATEGMEADPVGAADRKCEACDGKGGWTTAEWIDPVSGPEAEGERCGDCSGTGIESGNLSPDYSEMSRDALERHAARMAQALANEKPRQFYEKYAIGPMMAPSCLCCGHLPFKVAIQHAELPGIIICEDCVNNSVQPAAIAARVPGKPEGVGEAVALEWNDYLQISDEPRVDEALRAFSEDSTQDNAVCLIREILKYPAPVGDVGLPAQAGGDYSEKDLKEWAESTRHGKLQLEDRDDPATALRNAVVTLVDALESVVDLVEVAPPMGWLRDVVTPSGSHVREVRWDAERPPGEDWRAIRCD